MHDDHINIYGQMMKLTAIESPQSIQAVYTSGETQGYRNFRAGDRIGFRKPETLADAGEGKVVKAELLNDATMRIEIAGTLPGKAEGYWVETPEGE